MWLTCFISSLRRGCPSQNFSYWACYLLSPSVWWKCWLLFCNSGRWLLVQFSITLVNFSKPWNQQTAKWRTVKMASLCKNTVRRSPVNHKQTRVQTDTRFPPLPFTYAFLCPVTGRGMCCLLMHTADKLSRSDHGPATLWFARDGRDSMSWMFSLKKATEDADRPVWRKLYICGFLCCQDANELLLCPFVKNIFRTIDCDTFHYMCIRRLCMKSHDSLPPTKTLHVDRESKVRFTGLTAWTSPHLMCDCLSVPA